MKSKERFCYIFVISLLITTIGVMVALYMTGMLFVSKINQVSSVPLGSNVVISIENTGANSISFDLCGGLMPEEKVPQLLNVKNDGDTDCYVRAKAFTYASDANKVDLKIATTEKWVFVDGYYYFIEDVKRGTTIGLANGIILSDSYIFTNDQKYIINVLIESISTQNYHQDLWGVNISNLAI